MKTYRVNIDMTWSQDYEVKANSSKEAKDKAWEKFKKKAPKTDFKFIVEKKDV